MSIAHRAAGEKQNDGSQGCRTLICIMGRSAHSARPLLCNAGKWLGGKLVSRLPPFRPLQNNFRPIQTTSKHSDRRTISDYFRPSQNHVRLLSDNFRPRQTTSDHFSWLGLMLVARWLLAGCSRAARWLLDGCSLAARWLPAKLLVGCSPVAR